jgi:dephospho-CoA kinase
VPNRKPVIGIIGAIGSGKSTVARRFGELGAVVLDADRIGHKMLDRDDVRHAARLRWGNEVFGPDERIDRPALAGIVFGAGPSASAELKYLQELVHPLIGQQLRQAVEQAQQDAQVSAVVIDAALLVEAGWDRECDVIVYVDAEAQQRLERIRRARQWSEQEVAARQQAQVSLKLKRKRADYVVDNSGSMDATFQQVERLVCCIVRHPSSSASQESVQDDSLTEDSSKQEIS